jgi:hypothetical protein
MTNPDNDIEQASPRTGNGFQAQGFGGRPNNFNFREMQQVRNWDGPNDSEANYGLGVFGRNNTRAAGPATAPINPGFQVAADHTVAVNIHENHNGLGLDASASYFPSMNGDDDKENQEYNFGDDFEPYDEQLI